MNKTMVLAVGGLAVAAAAVWYFNRQSAETASSAPEVPVSGTALASVKVPAEFSPQAKIGETAFNAVCSKCHGPNAEGQKGVAPPLVHKFYEPSHHADMAFVLAAQNGVRSHHWTFGDMPKVEGLTRGDVLNIVAYVRELQRANGIN